MVIIGLQLILIVFAICSFCGKDFVSIGRHSWRCKSCINNGDSDILQRSGHLPVEKRTIVEYCAEITCCCGKSCKGVKGLQMHQHSCRVFNGLDENLTDMVQEDIPESVNAENENVRNQKCYFARK